MVGDLGMILNFTGSGLYPDTAKKVSRRDAEAQREKKMNNKKLNGKQTSIIKRKLRNKTLRLCGIKKCRWFRTKVALL